MPKKPYRSYSSNQASKAVLMASSVTFSLVFIHYTCDLTARMTSTPPGIGLKSFQDVKDRGYELVYYGFGLGGDHYLKTAPADSPMRWIYDNQIKGRRSITCTTIMNTGASA